MNQPLASVLFLQRRQPGAEEACGTCLAGTAGIILLIIGAIGAGVAILVWVARDAKNRGVENPILWMILVFFTSLLGLLIYLLARPGGNLVPCEFCRNKKLQYARLCPHCGNLDQRSSVGAGSAVPRTPVKAAAKPLPPGSTLGLSAPPRPPAAAPPRPITPTAPPAAGTLFCEECGAKLEPGSKFCDSCGAPVADEATETSIPLTPPALVAPRQSSPLAIVVGVLIGGVALVALILVVAAIAIPNLLRSRIAANQASAVGSLRTINTAEITYASTYNRGYSPDLASLGPGNCENPGPTCAGLIDSVLASGVKSGYTFTYRPGPSFGRRTDTYTLNADPTQPGTSGTNYYFTDQSGVIRQSTTGPAGPHSDPIAG